MSPDNLSIDPGPDASSPLGPPIPSAVLLVSNSTKGFGRFLGEKYAVTPVLVDKLGDFIYGASIAAVHAGSKKALLGGPMMRGVVACDWVDKIPASGGSGSGDKAAAAEKGKSKVKEEL
ncbi:hypothetical protein BC828DRAFT_8223 [Blastocladiella britannica]|nr:hypothetical protein BC828DRAFT_8223 [Blastocladiella britannica]